jgi:hypothetical protein
MQPVEPGVEWHINAAQNCGLDVVERNLEAGKASALMFIQATVRPTRSDR